MTAAPLLITHNAVIESARISNDDHGHLSAWLMLDYGSSCQGFGGYALFRPAIKQCFAGLFIWRCLEVAGVSDWSDLPGKTVRVRRPDELNGTIHSIGHIVKDVWFCPREEFQ